MKILITGSEGHLGTALKSKLRWLGHQVYGCDRFHTNDPRVFRADVAERRQLNRVFEDVRPELVYHFAAEFGRNNGRDYYEDLWRTNCIGTQNVISNAVDSRATLVFASSSEAYGLANLYAPGEKLTEGLLDSFSPSFHNEYALTKFTNEKQIVTAANTRGLSAIILRFFNVYGPGEKFSPYRSVACQFMYRALSGLPITVHRDSFRSHLFIDDWAQTISNVPKAIEEGLFKDPTPRPGSAGSGVPVFNVGSDELVSNEELFDKVADMMDIDGRLVTWMPAEEHNLPSKIADCSRAVQWLGHNPIISLEDGLRRTRQWMGEYYGI